MAKEFVLGMEALLIANAPEQFDSDNTVIIPMATIEELETYEGYPEETKNAKAVLKMLREIGINKLINEGFTQRNGSLLKVALDAPKEHNYKNKKRRLILTPSGGAVAKFFLFRHCFHAYPYAIIIPFLTPPPQVTAFRLYLISS